VADARTPGPDHLDELLRQLAAEDAPAVLERARARARARAERLIEDQLLAELLASAAEPGRERAPDRSPEPREEPPEDSAPTVSESVAVPQAGEAWWTYCVIWDENAVEVASGLEGVAPGSPVEAICDGQLAALVSRVPLAEYGDEQLRQHLEDLEWVERTARSHENVLEQVLQETTIVPLRLCTLYHDTDGVRRLLREHRAAFRDGLSRVDGCYEWGVKVFADTRPDASDPLEEPAGSENRGTSYLRRRQNERVLAEKASEVRARCADVVHQRIAGLSRASTINPPQHPEVHGRGQAMLLNSAHLIERDRRQELEQALAGLHEEWAPLGFAIELTGPWPPYNFVSGTEGVLS
jgi:Gas vesicle synthesis protein GvpL/GvpF